MSLIGISSYRLAGVLLLVGQDGNGSCLRLSVHAKPKVDSAVSGKGNKDSRHAVQRQNAQSSLEDKKKKMFAHLSTEQDSN